MKKKKDDNWNNLAFEEEVKIISGKHIGKMGKAVLARGEGNSTRLEIQTNDGNIFVDMEDVRKLNNNKPIGSCDLKLFLPYEDRAAWDIRVDELRRWNEGDPDIVSF